MREEGFYWVRWGKQNSTIWVWRGWNVARWKNGSWYIPGCNCRFSDMDFAEIDEHKIER